MVVFNQPQMGESLPKYQIGQKVWAVKSDKAGEYEIKSIVSYRDKIEFYYSFESGSFGYVSAYTPESEIYPTKEVFIESLK